MNLPEIRIAIESERQKVLDIMVLAFAADPFIRWLMPGANTYLNHWRPFADAFAGLSFDSHTALLTSGDEGAAMWLPPNVKSDEDKMSAVMAQCVAPELLDPLEELSGRIDEFHPTDDNCWYLAVIGVDPGHQNRGMGSAMMKHMTRSLDEKGAMAYLESSNPNNISLYERHGFEVMGKIEVANSPPMHPMIREAVQ